MKYEILIVDDEQDILELLSDILQDEGFIVRCASSGPEAIEAIATRQPNLVIQDIWLKDPKFDGLKVLEMVMKTNPALPVIMMSGHGTVETAVRATKMGAYDFIEKPFKADKFLVLIQRALEAAQLSRKVKTLSTEGIPMDTTLYGTSPAIEKIRLLVEQVAPSNSRILISGNAGTGKEMIARNIHAHSLRAKFPFEIINCAMLDPEHFENTLFGAEDADGNVLYTGKLEEAHGGTLLLDEVLDLPLKTQAKLVRTLHDMRFQRVGGKRIVTVDVRIMGATSGDIPAAVQDHTFREDLLYRLNVVPITMPRLSERQDDIPILIEKFMNHLAPLNNRQPCRLTEDAIEALKTNAWPGNVTQLRNLVEWILIMHGREKVVTMVPVTGLPITAPTACPPPEHSPHDNLLTLPIKVARETFEKEYLLAQVKRFSGNISRTASFVGMERSALHRKLKSLQLKRSDS